MASNEWLVRKLHEQDKKIEALSRGGTGVGHTSIAPGENLTVISDNGEVVLGAGGVEHVDGPTPATPSAPTLKLGFGTIETAWDGTFAEGEDEDGVPLTAPVDFDVVEVHCSTDPEEEEWGEDTMRGQIKTREGGTITVGGFDVDDEVFVCLIALAKTGKRSAPSATASLVIEGLDFSQLFTEIDAANATIKNAGEVLVTEQDTLNDKLSDAFGQIEDAVASANGKNVVHYEDRAPTVDDAGTEGDTWFVGQVGRPNDVVQATNFIINGNFANGTTGWTVSSTSTLTADSTFASRMWAGSFGYQASEAPMARATLGSTSLNMSQVNNSFTGTGFVAFSALVASELGAEIRSTIGFRNASGSSLGSVSSEWATADYYDGRRVLHVAPIPPGTGQVTVQLNFRGVAGNRMWVDRVMAVCGQSESSAIAHSETYFDGDTPPGETVNDPHYRWTGEPHASTSEKYLPATEGLSSNWNVTEQYRFVNGAWENVELSHTVLSSLDLGKLVAGSAAIKEAVVQKLWAEVVVTKMAVAEQFIGENAILTGAVTAPKITASEELWAKIAQFVKIRAEHIEADAIDGMVITGPNIRTAASGARVQMDVGGLRVFDEDDDQMVQLPSDGTAATFNGELVAKSLTSTGRASFLAENNRLEPGAGLVLAAGVGDPPSPPVVSNHYKQITPPALVDGESVSGLAYGDGLFWRAVEAGSGNNDLDRIEGIDRNGTIQRTIPLVNFWARNGLTVIGDELFALGIRDDRPANVRNRERWVRVYGLDGTYKRQWEYPNYGTGTYQPGIGSTPAGNVSIAQCWVDGKLSWRTFSPTGSLINTTTRDAPVKSDAVGIYGGTADFGATRTVFAKGFTPGTNRQFTVYGTNGNDYFPEQSWYSPGRGDVKGLAWDGEKFYSIDPAGVITEYGSLNMGDDSVNWWATYRWVGSGGKTTRIAPPARFAWPRRSRLRVSAPNLPQGVTTIEPSLAFKVTTPSRSDFSSPAWVAGSTPASVNYEVLDPYWYVGSPPGDVNNFPNSTPSSVKAASGLFEVKGDGSGRWGPLTFNADGTMSSSAVPAWVPITAFASGFSVQSWGFAPAYRVWPDGRVEWRGVVAGTINGTVHPFVIPAVARPAQPVTMPAAVQAAGTEYVTRVEFCPEQNPTQFRVYRGSADRTWVALDGLTYYKS